MRLCERPFLCMDGERDERFLGASHDAALWLHHLFSMNYAMAYFYRLIFFALLLCHFGSASAISKSEVYFTDHPFSGPEITRETATSVCNTWMSIFTWPPTWIRDPVSIDTNRSQCVWNYTTPSGLRDYYTQYFGKRLQCTANSVAQGNNCVCKSGFAEIGNKCVPDDGGGQCVAGAEKVDGQCQCKEGYKQDLGGCYPDKDKACAGLQQWCSDKQGFRTDFEGRGQGADFFCHAAEKFIAGAGGGGSSWEPEFPNCSKGCMISSGSTTVSAQDNSGQWWTKGSGKFVGSTCDPDVINKLNEGTPEEKEVKPPSTKPPGKCNGQQGTYNGVEVCLPYEKVTGDDKSKTETGADGSKKETTTKTTCTYSQCTTETKVVDKDKNGNTTGTSTTVVNAPKDEYCARNTASAVCKGLNPNDKGSGNGTGTGGTGGGTGGGNGTGGNGNGEDDGDKSSFGGSCQAGFTCEGDALQCAMAREQHRRNCELFEKDTDANSLTNRAINGSDDKSADAMRDRAQQVSVSTFDEAGFGWSSGCPADPSIPLNFGGRSSEFKIPFSRICGPLGILSSAGVGITLLGCLVWVLGGKKSSA